MDIASLKQRLARKATKLTAGGFRPTHQDDESWIGRIFLFRPEEIIPVNESGKDLLPVAQLYIPNMPFYSPLLKDTRLLTLFVGDPLPNVFEPMGNNWIIREYDFHGTLVRKELLASESDLKPFPLKAELVQDDFPLWDTEDIPRDLIDAILELEERGEIETYYDLVSHVYDHKIGGYPSFCQSGANPGSEFEFIFQISSDEKVNINIGDKGSLMFWKSRITGEWAIYYDYY